MNKKRLIIVALVMALVFSLSSVALAYTTSTVNVSFRNYKDSEKQYKPYTAYSNNYLYFTVYANVYETENSAIPDTDPAHAQLLKRTIPGFQSLPMQRKLGWNGDSTNYNSGLNASSYYTIQFGNGDAEYYIRGSVEIRNDGSR